MITWQLFFQKCWRTTRQWPFHLSSTLWKLSIHSTNWPVSCFLPWPFTEDLGNKNHSQKNQGGAAKKGATSLKRTATPGRIRSTSSDSFQKRTELEVKQGKALLPPPHPRKHGHLSQVAWFFTDQLSVHVGNGKMVIHHETPKPRSGRKLKPIREASSTWSCSLACASV